MSTPSPRRKDKKSPDLTETSGAEKSDAWTQHEHVAQPLQSHAQQLIDKAGSPGLARQAIAAAEQHPPARASSQDEFARRWGFRSYLELFETSTHAGTASGKSWRITAIPAGGWIAWNETDLRADRIYATREDALAHVPAADAV
jgi:hypothetical protein